jgi:GT2 family glycosyltransferase
MTRLAVVLASAGRPALLAEILRSCAAQRDSAFVGVISVPDEESLPAERSLLDTWRVVVGTRGLAAQRNAALDVIEDVDVVAFFDDDAVLRADYLKNALAFLDSHPAIVALTGRVLLDGASRGEIAPAEARSVIAASTREPTLGRWEPTRELYGCNFVVRAGLARKLRFDARLPLYSWLEDHDFARRAMRTGQLARVDDCVIVHRGATSGGRLAHRRLGYSQVMNPVYLLRKGSFPLWLTAHEIFRPLAKNLLLSCAGAAKSWRRTRLQGNLTAFGDILRGRITPERITRL